MNDEANDLDQAGEGIFSYLVSDEALEAAAGTRIGAVSNLGCTLTGTCFLPCTTVIDGF